jgi:hypothetical protein
VTDRIVAAWLYVLVGAKMLLVAAAVALVAISFFGCSLPARTITQQVPVPVPCEVPDIPRPPLPVDSVPESADIFVIDRALWASLEIIEGYVGQLRAAAEGCRSK